LRTTVPITCVVRHVGGGSLVSGDVQLCWCSHLLRLEDLLRELDADQRAAFVLTQVIGLTYDEAATVCDCPMGTIRSRVARARARIAEMIALADAV
jgi:DNA-directed RNA polymerase specialized sigma24 family protein